MIFVLILGGIIGLVNKVGAFDAGIGALSKRTKGKEFILVVLVFALTTLGGTTFGLAEETIAFYPILMPIFLISGFDAITCIAAIYMGSSIGTMFSTVNPFSVVIASNAAGINFTSGLKFRIVVLIIGSIITLAYMYWYAKKVNADPKNSLVYEENEKIKDRFLKDYDPDKVIEFTLRRKLIFLVFTVAFLILVWGVAVGGGCGISMSCDIRICSENAVCGQPEVGLGITPGFGGTQRLARIIGVGKAKEMIYSASNIKAEEAYRIGLVNAVYSQEELMDMAKKLANKIARNAPIAVRACKSAMNEGLDVDMDKAIVVEEKAFGSCFETEDQVEGMKAFLEKRKVEGFKNR